MSRLLLKKEMRLSASVLSYCFIAFALLTMVPGYPVLCGAFFITLGIYQSYRKAEADNDILFSALLPAAKRDVVKGKYLFASLIELCSFILTSALTLLRMMPLHDAVIYRENALMNANPFFLGMVLVIFGLFNAVFIGGFFKTAYKTGKPFVIYTSAAFAVIGAAESLHRFPGLEKLNAFGFAHAPLQGALLLCGAVLWLGLTLASYRRAVRRFERLDL